MSRLTSQGLNQPFAQKVREIAVEAGLDGYPIERYQRLAKEHNSNMRSMLQAVAAGEMMAG